MNAIKKKMLEMYPLGTKIKLIFMDDIQSPPKGTIGIVVNVDDIGQLIIKWDNGSSLNLLPETDLFEIIE